MVCSRIDFVHHPVDDVVDHVDVTRRQVRRVLAELENAGYVEQVNTGPGVANEYDPVGTPSAGEVDLADRPTPRGGGREAQQECHTVNVRVFGVPAGDTPTVDRRDTVTCGTPLAPDTPLGESASG